MDFSPPARVEPVLERIRTFLTDEVYSLEKEVGHRGFKASLPHLREKRAKVKAMGLWAPQLPAEYGGMGLNLVEFAFVSEALGHSPLGHYLFNCQAPDAGNMEILIQYGTDQQKARYLRPLAAGDIRSCFSMTEPELPGSNPTWMATTAKKEGSDYVINGHKWFATSAEGSTFAVCMAVTNPEAEAHLRASQIIVPTDAPGFRLVRNIPVMGHAGEDYASHGEIVYENCRVPQSNLLGPEGGGFVIAQERLGPGRIHHCMRWMGICERAFDLMCDRAAKREIAPGRPLGTRQIIQEWIAESRAEIHAARLMILHAAWKIENTSFYDAREEVSLIKFYAANVLGRVLDRALQVHGGLGVTDDTPLASFYRHERAGRIYDGADEVHKTTVARRILRRYGLSVS